MSGRLLTRGATTLRVNGEGALARMDLLGWRLAVSRAATASLEAVRSERIAGRVAHAVLLRGALRF